MNCLQMCRWTVSKCVGELSCRWTVSEPKIHIQTLSMLKNNNEKFNQWKRCGSTDWTRSVSLLMCSVKKSTVRFPCLKGRIPLWRLLFYRRRSNQTSESSKPFQSFRTWWATYASLSPKKTCHLIKRCIWTFLSAVPEYQKNSQGMVSSRYMSHV